MIVAADLKVAATRGPKMAVPMRTMVAPSAMAASKSALVPIDKRVETQAALVEIVEHLAGFAKPLALALDVGLPRAACT